MVTVPSMAYWIDKKPEIRRLKKWEAAWLAGVIDGEGSIGIYNGGDGRRVQVQCGNTSRPFLEKFREVIGCGSSVMRTGQHLQTGSTSHKGRKPMFHFSLKGSARCYWLLRQVVPFLIIKQEKAKAILHELETKPFGRWANASPEARQAHSSRLRAQWADPVIRAKRLAGMRRGSHV